MIYPGKYDIEALRWQPFRLFIDVTGYDLTGATYSMEVRQRRDQLGDALISLGTADLPAEGVWLTGVATIGGVPTSTLRISIGEDTIEQLPFAAEAGDDLKLVYDLVIEGAGLIKSRWMEGKFTVHGGSTQI